MLKQITRFALPLGLLLSGAAGAQCAPGADWGLYEVYSNGDHSVQFLVMVATPNYGDDASPLAGRTLIASNGATGNAYTFPNNAPSLKNNQFILVGTQGFADLNLIRPDFVVPNEFVFVRNGSVKLASMPWCGGPVAYAALPTDGVNAYFPDVSGDSGVHTGPAQAINFARESFFLTANHGGLWWNSPAGSEPGWGIVIEHQRDIVFAAWATYDTDGAPVWFVMPRAETVGPGYDVNSFRGAIYRTTGPPLAERPFDPSAVTVAPVGFGEFQFSGQGDGTFSYSIGVTSAMKTITRQIFADPVPVCQIVATAGPTPNFQGLWWNASEAGWGLHLTHQGDIIFAVWFTYDTAGKATWLAMTAIKTAPNNYAGAIYRTRGPAFSAASFDPAAVTETPVGTGTLTFADRNNGAFSYSVDAVSQTKNIARQIFATPPAVCN